MKRIILILWVALVSSGWLMANHWTPNSTPYEDNMTLTGIVRIDGAEQQTTMIEVGAFCGEECRGSARLAFFPPTQRYVIQLLIYGNEGDQLSLKLYNHEQNQELDLIPPDVITFSGNGYGSLGSPYLLDFYSEPPGPHVITVSAEPMEGGAVSGGGTYEHGVTATLTAMANEDYMFVNWTKDDVLVSNSPIYSFTVIEPGDYVANFVLGINPHWTPNTVPYEDNMTLTGVIQINGMEQQTPMLEVGAFCGEECRGSATLTFFEPTQRYVVQLVVYGNSGDPLTFKLYDHGLNEELSLYPTSAVSFTANGYGSLANPYVLNFTETPTEPHTVTATINLSGSGTITGTGTYLYGTTCTLTATANENYAFVNWTENGAMVSASSIYDFEVTADRSFVANFVPIESNHWTPNTAPYEDNMTLTGVVLINYVEQQTTALEVGVFCGEECRGAGRLAFFEPTQRYVIQLVIYGNENDQLTFKLYDHIYGEELDLVSPDAVSFTGNGYGTLEDPYMLSFLETYAITVIANPAEGGIVEGSGTYNYGTTATLIAIANTGYNFVNWTKGNEVLATTEAYSFIVTEAGDYVANFEESAVTQTTAFVPGWNWWSTYIEQEDIDGLDLLEEGLGNHGVTIKSQNNGFDSYIEGFGWYGSLDSINNESSYQVKVSEACEVLMTGIVANPADHPITLNTGWTWIGYPVSTSMSLEEALSGLSPMSNDMLKSQSNGFSSYLEGFGWYGSLDTLNPGMGLMYKSVNSDVVTFTYPDAGAKRGGQKPHQATKGNHWQPNLNVYPDNMTVMAVVELDDIELQADHYELAAFADGECRGSARLMYVEPLSRYIAFLTVAGDEAAELYFGLYNTETGAVETQCYASLQYETNAVIGSFETPYVVRFHSTTGVDEWASGLQIYPNPVEHGQILSIGVSDAEIGIVQVEIINAFGVVETPCLASPQTSVIKAPNIPGVHTLRMIAGDKVRMQKIVVR